MELNFFQKIECTAGHRNEVEAKEAEFHWHRVRLFDKEAAEAFLDVCLQPNGPQNCVMAKVDSCRSKPKNKWRPLPMDTVELEKLGSKKLRMSARDVMNTAEKLYTSGFISYPRTETNIFPPELRLEPLIRTQTGDNRWGGFARRILDEFGGARPRKGKKSDQAHPPIHPIKAGGGLQGNEARVYELITRHFLACCSKDAEGKETTVEVDVNGEKFTAHGLAVSHKNYLEVYIYDKWSDKELPFDYEDINAFEPTSIDLVEGSTNPPALLTEADLIALMDKHGIGTDATHAEHIETVKARSYIGLEDGGRLIPGVIGMALCEGYDAMGFEMSKPNLRAALEADLKLVCEGRKPPEEVLRGQIAQYRELFVGATRKAEKIDAACAKYLNENPNN